MRPVFNAAISALALTASGIAFTSPVLASTYVAPATFAELVEDVMPAVVNISTATKSPTAIGIGMPPAREGVSLGSGFIVRSSGLVVTNNHVIQNASAITVTLESGEEYDAVLRGVDKETDLAVLQITSDRTFPFVKFGNSDKSRVGDWVVAIGQPFGLGGSVSAGIISARNRNIESGIYDDYIQTDAAINKGNSGGPLFDMNGRVVGVNTIIYSQSGGSVGVGFAVPGTLANRVISQLIEFGETQRGYLGVLLEDISDRNQTRLALVSDTGALVVGVPAASGPAGLAGIIKDDVIIRFNGKKIIERRDLTRAVADTDVGSTVPVTLIRDGQRITVRVTMARRETMTARATGAVQMSGLTLQAATNEVTTLYGLNENIEGVVVTHVDSRSMLSEQLRPGDVILEIGWDKVRDPMTVENYLERLRDSDSGPVQILVQRGENLFYAHINP